MDDTPRRREPLHHCCHRSAGCRCWPASDNRAHRRSPVSLPSLLERAVGRQAGRAAHPDQLHSAPSSLLPTLLCAVPVAAVAAVASWTWNWKKRVPSGESCRQSVWWSAAQRSKGEIAVHTAGLTLTPLVARCSTLPLAADLTSNVRSSLLHSSGASQRDDTCAGGGSQSSSACINDAQRRRTRSSDCCCRCVATTRTRRRGQQRRGRRRGRRRC